MKYTCTIRGSILLDTYGDWIDKNDRVLDVGCGNGVMAKIIQNKYNCYIEGTDILDFLSVDMPFTQMKKETELPYDDKSFDILLLNDMLHHTRKQKQLLQEVVRVAKNIIIFETKPTIVAKILDHVLNWGHNVNMPVPLTHKSSKDWSVLFNEMNLKYELRNSKSGFFYPITHFGFKIQCPN